MSRKNDRKHAFSVVFQRGFESGGLDDVAADLEYYLENFADTKASEPDFILGEVQGVYANLETIDKYIGETADGWDIVRIPKVDLAIMRLAVYEILYADNIGKGVSINEAVELAKAYSTEESGRFINGVLGKIARKLD